MQIDKPYSPLERENRLATVGCDYLIKIVIFFFFYWPANAHAAHDRLTAGWSWQKFCIIIRNDFHDLFNCFFCFCFFVVVVVIELRPKGRGRPQRILTGSWPADHVHSVIRAVVFRDPTSLPRHYDREEASKLTANRASVSRILMPSQQSLHVYYNLSLTNLTIYKTNRAASVT